MPSGACRRPRRARRSARQVAVTALAAAAMALAGAWLPVAAAASTVAAGPTMVPSPATHPQDDPEVEAVLKGLMCRCGCNLTVYACEATMTCEVAAKMRADAEALLADGKTVPQVLDAFAADYGEQVLAAPTKKGFNLTVWVLPFVAFGVGAAIIAVALRSWRPRDATQAEEMPEAAPRYVAAVEEELKREV